MDFLNGKTVAELRQIAKDIGLVGYSKLRKKELIDAIRLLFILEGIPKSTIIKEIAEANNLEVIDIGLSQIDPIEFRGIPIGVDRTGSCDLQVLSDMVAEMQAIIDDNSGTSFSDVKPLLIPKDEMDAILAEPFLAASSDEDLSEVQKEIKELCNNPPEGFISILDEIPQSEEANPEDWLVGISDDFDTKLPEAKELNLTFGNRAFRRKMKAIARKKAKRGIPFPV